MPAHALGDGRLGGAAVGYRTHEISLRDHAHEVAVLEDDGRARLARDHAARGVADRRFG